MIRRDKDYNKLLTYARCVGLRVEVRKIGCGDIGLYENPDEDSGGYICIEESLSKLQKMLVLLHELGHHLDFLANGYPVIEALAYTIWNNKKEDEITPEWAQKLVWNSEERANTNIFKLIQVLDIKVPIFSLLTDLGCSRKYLKKTFEKGKISSSHWKMMKKDVKADLSKEVKCLRTTTRKRKG